MSKSVRDDDEYLTTDDSFSSDEGDRPLRPRTRTAPAGRSNVPWIVGGVIVVIIAAIGATVYILTHQGGALEAGSSQMSPSSTNSQAVSKPSTTSPILNSSGDGGLKEEEESQETIKPRPTTTKEEGGESIQSSKTQGGGGSAKPTSSDQAKPTPELSSGGGGSDLPPLFGNDLNVDFGSLSSADELEGYLSENGLWISDYGTVNIGPLLHGFHKENTDWVDGAIRMKVVGQTGDGEVSSSELATKDKFLYGRVTTRFRASPVPGVCHGIFWYGVSCFFPSVFSRWLSLTESRVQGSTLEVDIELLSSYYTEGLGDGVRPGVQLTNHPTSSSGGDMVNEVVPYGFDPTESFHDYSIEWKEGETIFEIDGKEYGRFTSNVPSEPMNFIWNR